MLPYIANMQNKGGHINEKKEYNNNNELEFFENYLNIGFSL